MTTQNPPDAAMPRDDVPAAGVERRSADREAIRRPDGHPAQGHPSGTGRTVRIWLGRIVPLLVAAGSLFLFSWLQLRWGSGELLRFTSPSFLPYHVDFDAFWHSSVAMLHGTDLYATGSRLLNLNPPSQVLLMAPLGIISPVHAYWLFTVFSGLLVVAVLVAVAREVRLPLGWAVPVIPMLLVSSPVAGTLGLGQIYMLLLAGIAGSWLAQRHGWDVAAGLLLGAAVAMKPTLAPLLLWPLACRYRRVLISALATGAGLGLVAELASPGATLAWARMVLSQSSSAFVDNAALPAAVRRLFARNELYAPLVNAPWLVAVAYLAGAAMVLWTAWVARRGHPAAVWALTAATLVAAPLAWFNYLVLVLPGVLVLLASRVPAGADRFGTRARQFMLPALAMIPIEWALLVWQWPVTQLWQSLYCLIMVVFWLVLVLACRKGAPGEQAAETADEPAPELVPTAA